MESTNGLESIDATERPISTSVRAHGLTFRAALSDPCNVSTVVQAFVVLAYLPFIVT